MNLHTERWTNQRNPIWTFDQLKAHKLNIGPIRDIHTVTYGYVWSVNGTSDGAPMDKGATCRELRMVTSFIACLHGPKIQCEVKNQKCSELLS